MQYITLVLIIVEAFFYDSLPMEILVLSISSVFFVLLALWFLLSLLLISSKKKEGMYASAIEDTITFNKKLAKHIVAMIIFAAGIGVSITKLINIW